MSRFTPTGSRIKVDTVKNKFFTDEFVIDAQICGLLEAWRVFMEYDQAAWVTGER